MSFSNELMLLWLLSHDRLADSGHDGGCASNVRLNADPARRTKIMFREQA